MAETYKKIYPGNWVERISAYPLPNADFKKNKRPAGDPHDRQQQGVLIRPGTVAVHKVAYLHVSGAAPTGSAVKGNDLTIASPDARGDDKPRSDVTGLIVPSGAHLYRLGLRVPRSASQPGAYSSGAKDAVSPERSGLLTNAGGKIWLEAKATDPAAAPTGGAITATGANTPALTVNATSGDFDAAAASFSLLTPTTTTSELTIKLWADKGGVGSTMLGGVYLVAEVCYLVDDSVADLESLVLPGAQYAGYTG